MKKEMCVLFTVLAIAASTCPDYCGNYNSQVCGFNGVEKRIFQNVCKMHVTNCQMMEINKHIFNILPLNECGNMAETPILKTDKKHNCNIDKFCTNSSSMSKTVCGENLIGDEIERKLFKNLCEMEKFNCKFNANYIATFSYKCAADENLLSESNSSEMGTLNENNRNHCDQLCVSERKSAVCGSNGEDYKFFSNTCEMKVFNCKQENEAKVFHPAYAYKCVQNICKNNCTDDEINPVCGFNGKFFTIFDNSCKMKKANCELNVKNQFHFVNEKLCALSIKESQMTTSTEPEMSTTNVFKDEELITKIPITETTEIISTTEVVSTTQAPKNPQQICIKCRSLIRSKKCPKKSNPNSVWCWLCEQAVKNC